jgi:NDP-sugar pyrophosphorylase family protein
VTLPALVLAAGYGTRLDPLTRLLAKPAVPLAGKPLVEHVLRWVRRQGVHDVVVNLHHLPATITAVVGDGAHLDLVVRYSWEQPLLGSAGGPRHALPLLDAERFLIVNGDTLCAFDVAPMVAAHEASGADVTMAIVENPDPQHYNGLLVDDAGIVTGFVGRGPSAAGSWHFIGVQVAERRLFAGLPDGVPYETVAGLYRDAIARLPGRIRTWHARTPFLDVGTPADYLRAALDDGAHGLTARSVVWPGARVADGADLDECLVVGPVVVPAGFRARRAILAPPAILRAGDGADVREDVAVFPIS